MDMSGSTLVPEHSASVSESGSAGNAELPNGPGEGQSTASPASAHSSAARFHIRSAKERQRMLDPTKGLKKVSRVDVEATKTVGTGCNDSRKEAILVPSPSPDAVTDPRTTETLNKVSVAKDPALPSEASDATQGKPDCAGSLTARVRGRTEWRGANLSSRSKSLDWRGSDRGKETVVMRNTSDFRRSPRIRSESFEEPSDSPKSKEPTSPSSSVLLRIQEFNAISQGKQDSTVNLSPVASGYSSVRMGRVSLALERAGGGQSLPSRLKPKERQDSIEDKKSLWLQSGQNSPKLDQAEVRLRSQVSGSKVSEITEKKSIQDRIGKLYRLNSSEENTDANSRDSIRAKRYSAPVGDWLSGSDAFDSNSVTKRSTIDSTFGLPSSSSFSPWRRVSSDIEKGASLPRKLSKKDGIDFMSTTDSPSILPNRTVRRDTSPNTPVPPLTASSKERPLSQDSAGLLSGSSDWNGTLVGESMVLGTHSLDRARSRKSTPALLRAAKTESLFLGNGIIPTSNAGHPTPHEIFGKEIESDRTVEKKADHSTYVKVIEVEPSKPLHGPQETHSSGQPKPQLSRGMTVDGEKAKGHDSVFELGSLTIPRMKKEASLEKVQAPSFDSVRNTIHKFEALAQQNKTLGPRRTLSFPERPNLVISVTKSSSDKSLDEWKSSWKTRSLRENIFSRSEVQEDTFESTPFPNRPTQTTATDKVSSTTKTQTRVGSRQELLGAFASEAKDDAKDNMKVNIINRHLDEPDFSKASQQNTKIFEPADDRTRNDLTASTSRNSNNKSGDVSRSELEDFSPSKYVLDARLQTQDLPPSNASTKDARASESIRDSVKSASLLANNTHSNTLSIKSGSTLTTPVQVISPAPGALNNLPKTTRDEKVAAKVSRWIAYEGVGHNSSAADGDFSDDEEDDDDEGTEREDDSDSGESSVTITSNMSQSDHRSFSLSLVDLCNLGGLDYPASDGNGSKDEEKWMSRRSASLSSDISVLSSVTLLGTEELDCLLDDVRNLGEDALQNCEDVKVVVLHKEVGRGLGFTVAGGVDQNKPVTVHRVFPYGAAGQQGSIQEGDQVLSINGTALHNSAHWEALRTLRKARGRGMAVVVLRRGNAPEAPPSTKDGLQKAAGNPAGSRVRVTLTKSSADLGFSLEGGVGSSLGDKPLTVQRLFLGGPVGKVYPGDQLLEVEGQCLGGLRRLEAWNLIKRLPPGPVEVLLHRPHLPH